MATDWAADVKKYDAKADSATIAGIVRYCGIALRNRDSALVSFSDKAETDRVRTNFLKKKLALTQADSVLDAAIAKVGEAMKADRTKNRVTVYYLLASEFKQLGLFIKAAPAAKKVPAAKAAPTKAAAKPAVMKSTTATKVAGVTAVAAGAAAGKAKPATTAPAKKAPAAKPAVAPAKKAPTAAPAKQAVVTAKAPAPAKKAAAPTKKALASAKASTAKAAAPAANATQGMLDKAATTASDAAKAAPRMPAAAAAGTVAAVGAAATGAAGLAKDTGTNAADTASRATSAAADKPSALTAGGAKPATSAADDDGSEMNWLWWAIGIAVLGFLFWWWVSSRNPDIEETNATEVAASANASDVGTDLAAAKPEGSEAIPAGAGVTSELRDGKPVVKVYFDSGMTAVTPEFAKTAGGLKSWLDSHSGTTLAVSGYSDPSGNAAANAELAKQRAQAVQSALVAAGIPATSAALVKPEQVSDATVAKEAARRVEVVVK